MQLKYIEELQMGVTSSLDFENLKKSFERNAITSDLNKAASIVSNPISQIPIIKHKFQNADYPDLITVSLTVLMKRLKLA